MSYDETRLHRWQMAAAVEAIPCRHMAEGRHLILLCPACHWTSDASCALAAFFAAVAQMCGWMGFR